MKDLVIAGKSFPSRLLLGTGKFASSALMSAAIAEIGTACAFPNTSHFIKLFRKQYGMTPATYRARHRGVEDLQTTPETESTAREPLLTATP